MQVCRGFFVFGIFFFALFLSTTQCYSYTITASGGTGGTISPSGAIEVTGDDQTFIITPGSNNRVSDILVDGVSEGPSLSYTFTNVTTDHTIEALFSACDYSFPILLDGYGYYDSIMIAYDDAFVSGLSDITLMLMGGSLPAENIYFDANILVRIQGGYDCSFLSSAMITSIPGSLTISAGTVMPSNLMLVAPPLCEPGDPNNFPGNPEICDGMDNNCNGLIDDGLTFDVDTDGYTAIGSCEGSADDCDDNEPTSFPGNPEICDDLDNNCDLQVDEGLMPTDADNDGFTSLTSCGGSADDCDDTDPNIHPGATEIFGDYIDQDCDGIDVLSSEYQCFGCHSYFQTDLIHQRDITPDTSCVNCHGLRAASLRNGHYGQIVITPGNNLPAGHQIRCKTCHDRHADENDEPFPDADGFFYIDADFVWPKVTAVGRPNISCYTCHETLAVDHESASAHNHRMIDPLCANCHTSDTTVLGQPGNGTLETDADINALHTFDGEECLHCHSYIGTAPDAVIVAQAITDGFAGADISCLDCHGDNFASIHAFLDNHNSLVNVGQTSCGNCHSDPPPLVDAADPKVHHACTNCHDENYNRISLAVGKSFTIGGDCTTCHGDHFPNHAHHSSLDNKVSYNETVDTSQIAKQGCALCHHDYDSINSSSLGLSTWETILIEHDLDGTKDGSTNACYTCHAYAGNGTVPLAAVQNAIASGNPATCATCHTDKVPDVVHHIDSVGAGCGSASECHGTFGSHPAHVDPDGILGVDCSRCHDTDNFPNFIKDRDELCAECHDDGTGNPVNPPAWGDDSSEQCSECHAAQPSTGSHTAHLAVSFIECGDCHENAVQGSIPPSQHLDGNIDVYKSVPGDLAYNPDKAKGSPYGICYSYTCHIYQDTAYGNQVYTKQTPVWGTSAPDPCGICHANPLVPEQNPSWPHTQHLTSAVDYIRCGNCHEGVPEDITEYPLTHIDGVIGVGGETTSFDSYSQLPNSLGNGFGTCNGITCHGGNNAAWSSDVPLTDCRDCHMGSGDVDDYSFNNGITARIDSEEWYYSGHGRSSGTFDVSGNPAPNHDDCFRCHTNSVGHGDPDNPFRIATHGCEICHYLIETHYGSSHGDSNDGGSLCFDCHDPHGERTVAGGNIYMIHDSVTVDKSDDYGRPATTAETVFTNNASATDYASDIEPFKGICQVCHTNTSYYRNDTGANGHFTDTACTACHPHSNEPPGTTAFNHGGGNTDCQECHDHDPFPQAPTLAWTDETGYEADGAGPDSGPAGSTFIFRIAYTDLNNDPPGSIELWIDLNGNDTYEEDAEKYPMTGVDSGDVTYYDGKLYTKSLLISGAGDNIIKYRFYASDGVDDATGFPTGDGSIAILNNVPNLSWTGEPYFVNDGVNPDIGGLSSNYEFRIKYSDAEGDCPTDIQVWIDLEGDGYETDQHDLTAGAGNCETGIIYYWNTSTLFSAGGNYKYRFYASDDGGVTEATGEAGPVSDNIVSVDGSATNPPQLYRDDSTCFTEGVRPALGAAGADFDFAVKYIDPGSVCPPTIQVWIDLEGDGYEADDKHDLTAGTGDCGTGKIYTYNTADLSDPISLTAEGPVTLEDDLHGYHYRFYANNGTEDAIGEANSDSTVTVVDAVKVRPEGGTGWYSTIQDAVNASTDPSTILVYPNEDFTAATYSEHVFLWDPDPPDYTPKNNRTIQSTCGAELTIISSPYGEAVIEFSNTINDILDGFQLIGGYTGYGVWGGTGMTIRNCWIHGNMWGITISDSSSMAGEVTIENNRIYSNTSYGIYTFYNTEPAETKANITGSEIYENGNSSLYFVGGINTITNTTIRDNALSYGGMGGAIYMENSANADFRNCTITGNSAPGGYGGAIYVNTSSGAAFENCIIADNQAEYGGAVAVNFSTTSFINVTFADNVATSYGGAISASCDTTDNTIKNSIFWNNTAPLGSNANYGYDCSSTTFMNVTNSDITTGAGYIDGGTIATDGSNIDPGQDPKFVGVGDYHIAPGSPVIDQANGDYAPNDDIDGDIRPVGDGDDMGADEFSSTLPVLAWPDEVNYTDDGVDPDSGIDGAAFEFRIDYTDADNIAPVLIQVWIDEDDNGVFSGTEKYAMTEIDSGDTDYTDGKRYSRTLSLATAGDTILNYRFSASIGTDEATGAPTTVQTIIVE